MMKKFIYVCTFALMCSMYVPTVQATEVILDSSEFYGVDQKPLSAKELKKLQKQAKATEKAQKEAKKDAKKAKKKQKKAKKEKKK